MEDASQRSSPPDGSRTRRLTLPGERTLNVIRTAWRCVLVVVGVLLVFLAATGTWLLRYLPRGRRIVAAVSMVVGMIVSLVAYAGYVGPWLLP